MLLFFAASTAVELPAGDFSAVALKEWLAIAFYIIGGITACVGLWKMISGQSLEVRAASEYATTAQLARVEQELKADLTKGALSRKKMHEEIESVRIAQARLDEKAEGQTRQLHALDSKIENLPEKIVRLMRKD